MVNGFNIGIAIATTLRIMTEQLRLPLIPLVICTDLYSLYECLVKLRTTKEKRLIINIMALRQSYNVCDKRVAKASEPPPHQVSVTPRTLPTMDCRQQPLLRSSEADVQLSIASLDRRQF